MGIVIARAMGRTLIGLCGVEGVGCGGLVFCADEFAEVGVAVIVAEAVLEFDGSTKTPDVVIMAKVDLRVQLPLMQ